jgi:drug/metabolite transporter (DMT)-like permease
MGRAELSRKRQALADASLVVVTFIWGATFVLVKDLVAQTPPLFFLTLRFAIGALALILLVTVARRWAGFSLPELGWGCAIGFVLGLGYAFQTVGLQYTTASNAAFITSLSVVLAPILGLFIVRQVPGAWSVLGVIMAAVGLALLSLRFDEGINPNWGDAIVLGCAFAFALQIVMIARAPSSFNPLRLAMIQLVVAGITNGIGSLIFESPPTTLTPEIWAGAAFLGVMASAFAFAVQTTVQRYTTVVHTSLIFTLEPVFATLFGAAFQGDRLGPIALTGATMIILGMLFSELGPFLMARRQSTQLQ